MSRKTIFAFTVLLFALPASADTRLQYVDENSGVEQTAIIIKDGRIRMNNADAETWTLFDSHKNTLTTVDPAEKTYTVLDEETMRNLSGQVSEAMKEMQRQLEQMPPQQREMMEKMMGGAADMGKAMVETKVDRTGKTLNKGDYECEQVFYSVGNLARSELCVIDMNEIEMSAADRDTLQAMQKHMKAIAQSMSRGAGVDLVFDFDAMGGMPVYMKEDKKRSGEVLESVGSKNVNASDFRIPDEFREEKLQAPE